MDEINELKNKLQIAVLTPDDLKLIIEKTAETTTQKMMILLEGKLAEQKDFTRNCKMFVRVPLN